MTAPPITIFQMITTVELYKDPGACNSPSEGSVLWALQRDGEVVLL